MSRPSRRWENDRSATKQALLVVVIVAVAAGVGGMLSGETDIVRGLVFGVVRGVMLWALWALMAWIVGTTILRTPETVADWGELARGTGFAQTPGVLNALVFIPGVGLFIGGLVFFWQLATMVIAIRQCLDYTSTLRAVFVILISLIPVLIIYAVIILVLGIGESLPTEEVTEAAEQAFRVLGIGGFAAA